MDIYIHYIKVACGLSKSGEKSVFSNFERNFGDPSNKLSSTDVGSYSRLNMSSLEEKFKLTVSRRRFLYTFLFGFYLKISKNFYWGEVSTLFPSSTDVGSHNPSLLGLNVLVGIPLGA